MALGKLTSATAHEITPRQSAPFRGGFISNLAALEKVLSRDALVDSVRGGTPVSFDATDEGDDHEVRLAMMTLAFGTRPARAKAALTLCTRLARTMDGRSQDCVLLSSVHETSTFASEVIIWMLPHEPLVEKGIGRVQLGDARGQTAGLRKAAAFKGMNTHTGFRKGVALDRQTSTGDQRAAEFWISRFLDGAL